MNSSSSGGSPSASRPPQIERADINEIIESIINLIRYNARYKSISIYFEKSDGPLKLSINKTEIKQVILDMIKNSFEAMPESGELAIQSR